MLYFSLIIAFALQSRIVLGIQLFYLDKLQAKIIYFRFIF